jgi:CRISPR/Cas system-associated protein Cas10 (large subunit of type III CRISPR-Cas system)
MKECTVCGKEKDAGEFQVRRASHDGLTAACRVCLKERDRARYQKERDYRSIKHKEYMATATGKEIHAKAARKWVEQNRVKRAAHVITGHAIRSGKLVPGLCEVCGAVRVDAHHEDYDKPLDVIWLCQAHHKQLHAKRK